MNSAVMISIRQADVSDAQAIANLVTKLAIFEKKDPKDVGLTIDKITEHCFGEQPYFQCLVAEANDNIVGFALFFYTYAASLGAPILYLEDLYVEEPHRGKGIGTQFLRSLVELAKDKKCCRVEWHAFTWNTAGIEFYKKLGAELKEDLVQIRLAV